MIGEAVLFLMVCTVVLIGVFMLMIPLAAGAELVVNEVRRWWRGW